MRYWITNAQTTVGFAPVTPSQTEPFVLKYSTRTMLVDMTSTVRTTMSKPDVPGLFVVSTVPKAKTMFAGSVDTTAIGSVNLT